LIVVTLDTGALIAMERHKTRAMMLLRAAREYRARLHAITPVITEWWHGRTDVREKISAAIEVVPFPLVAARAAGVALTRPHDDGPSIVDVMVMAYAATVGGALVYTSDTRDHELLRRDFPSVRVLAV
jgi:predicted nucleic acid-binding protein